MLSINFSYRNFTLDSAIMLDTCILFKFRISQ